MRVTCPNCQSRALITSSNELTPTVRDLYCNCTNIKKCGATFVSTVGFKHYLNPPVSTTQQLAANLINSLPKEERKVLLQGDFFGN